MGRAHGRQLNTESYDPYLGALQHPGGPHCPAEPEVSEGDFALRSTGVGTADRADASCSTSLLRLDAGLAAHRHAGGEGLGVSERQLVVALNPEVAGDST